LLIGLIVAVVLLCAWYPPIQNLANEQVDAGLKRALISFATARTLNGVISVVQGTELAVAPAGVGVTLTLGQILDPINDLVEEFSSLMLVASVAFGVQKMLLVLGAHWVISLLVSAVVVAWGWLHLRRASPQWLTRTVLVLLMVRFAIPVVTLGSDLVFQQLMAKAYLEDQAALDIAAHRVGKAGPEQTAALPAQEKGLLDNIRDTIKARINGFVPDVPNLGEIKTAVEQVPERIVKLIVVFLMQTMIIPIFIIWALFKVAAGAFGFSRASGRMG